MFLCTFGSFISYHFSFVQFYFFLDLELGATNPDLFTWEHNGANIDLVSGHQLIDFVCLC